LKRVVSEHLSGATLLLYGSAARGARAPDSDYDVLLLTQAPLSCEEQDRIRGAVYELELAREVVISIMFDTHQEWSGPLAAVTPYHRSVEREGLVV
jgi:predicted nucleotidyltransferase